MPDLVQICMRAFLPGFDPAMSNARMAAGTLVAGDIHIDIGRLIEKSRRQVLVHGNGLPPFGKLAFCQFRSEEHTSELQSLMRISYAVFCLKKKNTNYTNTPQR